MANTEIILKGNVRLKLQENSEGVSIYYKSGDTSNDRKVLDMLLSALHIHATGLISSCGILGTNFKTPKNLIDYLNKEGLSPKTAD